MDATPEEQRWIDLPYATLKEIADGQVPTCTLSWEGIEGRKDFQKFFKNRANPAEIAKILLKDKAGSTGTTQAGRPAEASDALRIERLKAERARHLAEAQKAKARAAEANAKPKVDVDSVHALEMERLNIRRLEAEAKIARTTGQTVINDRIMQKLQRLEASSILTTGRLEEACDTLGEILNSVNTMLASNQGSNETTHNSKENHHVK